MCLVAALALTACDSEGDGDKAGDGGGTPPASAESGGGDSGDDITRFGGKPYKVYADGKVDYNTWRGANLYAGECLRCHGEYGEGSSFAPSLLDALKTLDYSDFVNTVTNGITAVDASQTEVMPSFGDNATVMKYVDSIYAYLKGLSDGAIPQGNLEWKGPKDE